MQRKISRLWLSIAAACLLLSIHLRADDGWDRAVLRVTEENDSQFSDRHYTQGAKIGFLSHDYETQNWLTRHVPSIGYDVARWKWGVELGQEIYTPEDIAATKLIRDDRPYAGWLYGGLVFQQRGSNEFGGVMATFRIRAGVVGPESQGDDTQITWHHFWGFQHPSGWRHQLGTEAGGVFSYDRRHRFAWGDDWSIQFLPEAGCDLGNVRTDFHAGGMLRLGYDIPNEFGVNDSRPGANWGMYAFGGLYGQAVLLDVFLDGNNFRHSPSVDKEPFIFEGRFGVAVTSRHFEISVAHIQRSIEFAAQKQRDGFTSLTLTMKF